MILKNHFSVKTLFALVLLTFFSGCSGAKTQGQKIFNNDSDYYVGLQLLAQNDYRSARHKFTQCMKKGSYWCARKSAEALTTFGDIQEKNQAVLRLVEKYKDSDSLLIAARQLTASSEIHKLIELTKNLDLTTENDELISLRLTATQKRGDSSFKTELFDWFTTRKLSEIHNKFYRDNYNHPVFYIYDPKDSENSLVYESGNSTPPFSAQEFAINYRIKLYRRDYGYCLKTADILLNYFDTKELPLLPELASDLGKAFLYGSTNFTQNSVKFHELAEKFKDTEIEHYFWFYSGRFLQKTQKLQNHNEIINCFEKAINSAKTTAQKDNAIWYLIDYTLTFNLEESIEFTKKYCKEWSDPSYFDDYFEKLIMAQLSSGNWNSLYQVYSAIAGYANDETTAQFAYVYGRLLQEGLAKPFDERSVDRCIKSAFEQSLKSGTSMYYKILSAYQLHYSKEELEEVLCFAPNKNISFGLDQDADSYLRGLAFYGFSDRVYDEYMNLYKKGISTDTTLYLSEFLLKCADRNNDYYTQSLRIAARAMNYGDRPLTKEELKLLYPTDYSEYVEPMCKKYNCEPPVMYALIRSESFFDADVVSHAGAIGLCQFMETTAADVAHRLKREDYSLTKPEDSIEFGCYYLNNLYTRCNSSYLQAFFSYNAGFARVGRWLQSSLKEFGKKENMPEDLFLETVPYSETRDYGRKLVSASVLYDWIYNNSEESDQIFAKMIENLIY